MSEDLHQVDAVIDEMRDREQLANWRLSLALTTEQEMIRAHAAALEESLLLKPAADSLLHPDTRLGDDPNVSSARFD